MLLELGHACLDVGIVTLAMRRMMLGWDRPCARAPLPEALASERLLVWSSTALTVQAHVCPACSMQLLITISPILHHNSLNQFCISAVSSPNAMSFYVVVFGRIVFGLHAVQRECHGVHAYMLPCMFTPSG